MMMTPDPEVEALLGAYALDAVDDLERARVDRYLATSPRARAEVDDHMQVAMMLGNSAGPAPVHVWEQISAVINMNAPATITSTPPAPQLPRNIATPARGTGTPSAIGSTATLPRTRKPTGLALVAAACVAILVGLSTFTFNQSRRISELQTSAAEAKVDASRERERARRDQSRIATLESELISSGTAEARVAQLLSTSTGKVVELQAGSVAVGRVVFDPRTGEGFIIATGLQPLPNGRTYQLWGVQGETVLSLGVLGQKPTTQGFSADGTWSAFVLTEEASPGVASSKNPALAVAKVVST